MTNEITEARVAVVAKRSYENHALGKFEDQSEHFQHNQLFFVRAVLEADARWLAEQPHSSLPGAFDDD